MQNPLTARRLATLAVAGALALAGAASVPAQAANPNTGGATKATGVDKTSVIVQLSGDPLATSTQVGRAKGRVDLANGKTKNVQAQLAQQRNAFRTWLKANAPQAKITGEYDLALNGVAVRLNGTSVDTLKAAPGVTAVAFQNTYVPTSADPDLALIDALEGWDAAGASNAAGDPTTWAGYGVKVGVIDTGIDYTHPCFDDAGYPDVKELGDTRFTNDKVIVARVFNNKLNQNKFTAEAIQDHGTHVAGTIACNLETPASVEGADIPYDPSGVAPGALLGSYVVFPGDVESARTEDIANAMEAAFKDGMDVINLSLGGDAHGNQDLGTVMIDNLDRAGVVMAVSAGNEGPSYLTTGSPGSAERALTAGASSVGHIVGVPISSGGSQVAVAAIGDFPVPAEDLTAPLGVVTNADDTLSQACTPLAAGSLAGKIALISRGSCTFGTKVFNAEAAGAVGVIIVNNVAGDPIAMATDAAFPTTIPAVQVAASERAELMTLNGNSVTIGADRAYEYTGNKNLLESFSSVGPVDVSYRIKPDVVAPGGNVLSALPQAQCSPLPAEGCWGLMSGTSMAAPHLAGMAAVVRAAHPGWDAWQVRSAIVNTAEREGVLALAKDGTTSPVTDVQKVGSGLADLDAAVNATLALSRTSVSFGAVASGSGKTSVQTVQVTNVGTTTKTIDPRIEGATIAGLFSATAAQTTLAPGETTTVTVTLALPKFKGAAQAQAHLYLDDVTHAALYVYAK
nr:S8 family serine peptidase [Propionibacterium sp.]